MKNGWVEAREDGREVMETYKKGIDQEQVRMNASHNEFVKTCCLQNINQLKAEKDATLMEVVG